MDPQIQAILARAMGGGGQQQQQQPMGLPIYPPGMPKPPGWKQPPPQPDPSRPPWWGKPPPPDPNKPPPPKKPDPKPPGADDPPPLGPPQPGLGATLSGPHPLIMPSFRHLFSQDQVDQYGVRQPMIVNMPYWDGSKLVWQTGKQDWWDPDAPLELSPPKPDKNGDDDKGGGKSPFPFPPGFPKDLIDEWRRRVGYGG